MVEFESAPIFAHVKKKSIDTTPVGLEGCRKEVGSEVNKTHVKMTTAKAMHNKMTANKLPDNVRTLFRLSKGTEEITFVINKTEGVVNVSRSGSAHRGYTSNPMLETKENAARIWRRAIKNGFKRLV